MAYEPLIRDSNGSGDIALRKASTTEENYLAYRMGLYLADGANISPALLTINASGATAIGSHANTYYNSTIRSGSVAFDDTTTETVTLYQKNRIFNETDSDVRHLLSYSNDQLQDEISFTKLQTITELGVPSGSAGYVTISNVSGNSMTIQIPSSRNSVFDRFCASSINTNGTAVAGGNISLGNALHEPPKLSAPIVKGVTTGRYVTADSAYVFNVENVTIGGTAYSSSEAKIEYEAGDNYIYVDGVDQDIYQSRIDEFDSDEVTGLSNRLISRVFTSDYPGTMKLATAAPSGDYTLVQEAFRDTRGNDDSDVNIYNLYKRTSMSAPSTIRPFSIKRASGSSGTYEGLQALSDRQIEQTFGSRARHLINPDTSSVGAYQLRSAVQGAPTDTGTWVSKGTATDTRNVAVEEDYTRNCQVTRFTDFVGNYTGNFTGTFQNTTTNVYAGDYLRDFTGNYVGTYLGENEFSGQEFQGNYQGNFTQSFTGNYLRDFIGNFLATSYTGNFSRDYLRDFTGDFTGNFQRDNEIGPYYYEVNGDANGAPNIMGGNHKYTWFRLVDATSVIVTIYYNDIQYMHTFASAAEADAATELTVDSSNSTELAGRTFVRGTVEYTTGTGDIFRFYKIAEKFTGADTGPLYTQDYSRNYTRDRTWNFVADTYTRNFQGPLGPLNPTQYDYVGDFVTEAFLGNFTGNFTNVYTGEFLSSFTRNSTRNSQDNYTTEYTTTYTDSFATGFTNLTQYTRIRNSTNYSRESVGNYIATYIGPFNYQGNSSAFTRNRQIDSVGNYIAEFDVERDILETYIGTYAGNFVGDFTGNFIGFELSPTNTTINTYTLYVRVA